MVLPNTIIDSHTSYILMKDEVTMPTRKIAITLPDVLLQGVDQWAAKFNQSRSHFIAAQIKKQLRELEDAEVTQLYNTAKETPI